jgi:hypothetical protein
MKCPHCKYVSFDFLDVCKKCGKDLIEIKAKHNIVTFCPAFIPTGDAAFNIALPPAAEAAPQEQTSREALEIEEEAAAIPSEAESTIQLTFEPTDLTMKTGDTAEVEKKAVEPEIPTEEGELTLAMEEEKGLLLGDETIKGPTGAEEDMGKTLSAEESLGETEVGISYEEALGAETISPEEQLEPDLTMKVMEKGEEESPVRPLVGGEPELELDMEALEIPSKPTEEPTPPGGVTLVADMEPAEDQEPAMKDENELSEPTVKLTSSPLPRKVAETELDKEEDGIIELDISEEDFRRLDENK